ncbi:MAG: hypothetical protein ABSA83_00990 [Verrucomicrobiota bacterium]|jgi:hypothetical protein
MNLRALVKGKWGCFLFLMGTALGAMQGGLHGAVSQSMTPVAAADDASNPYSVIVEKNIFHLTTPPPPPSDTDKAKEELPVVKITGFVNIGNTSRVLFLSQPKDKKEGPFYYSLAEGEKSSDGKFELVKISPAQDEVDVINAGVAMKLTVKDNSLGETPAPTAAAPSEKEEKHHPGNGMPGRPMFPQGRTPPPGIPGLPGAGNGFSFPARARRTPPSQQ